MARTKGTLSLASNIEPSMNAPLDGRQVVNLYSDLTANGSFPYYYEGMIVACKENHKLYQLTGTDTTATSNWTEVGSGSGGADNIIEGYRKDSDGLFYEESTFTIAITGASNTIYIDLLTDTLWRYNGSYFVTIPDVMQEGDMADVITPLPTPGGGGADNVIEGYRNPSDDLFYEEDTYTTAITGASNILYIDLLTNEIYRWDGTNYVPEVTFMDSSEMSDIVTPLPSARTKYHKYSTEEQVVGEWIDGSKLYEKTLTISNFNAKGAASVSHGIVNLKEVVYVSNPVWYDTVDAQWRADSRLYFSGNVATSYAIGGTIVITSTDIVIDNESSFAAVDWSNRTERIKITIQYTKTTD